ncbi:MAG TPA: PLP-dependent aspartate aminotransferase family protein [Candidatus Saccharimonadales bacterium]|jgi:cystathionine beta-lyase/cystathionine gamma-synthase|nr:PLP-dependent aspartate aminotransferase family protein [Candidatus Saccharimonadales bacterium]
MPDFQGISTLAIHGGQSPDPATGAILTPIYQSTTFVQEAVGQHKGFTYSRAGNPTVEALERALGAIEDAPPAVCFSSGMAATTTLLLSLLKSGDHVIISDVVYGGTTRLARQILAPLGIATSFVDTSNADAVRDAITPQTRLVFIETPANPTLKLSDIAALAGVTRAAGIKLAVDNTFLTPLGQRSLELGADISLLSTTKYVEGHNATVGGSVTTRDTELLERLRFVRKTLGTIQSPQEAWLTLRGLKTLPFRIRLHSENALVVAKWLQKHPAIRYVLYPGLESFSQHELAARQQLVSGGLISFEVKGGKDAGLALMNSVRLCSLAENLGAVETLITHPVTMTHADVPVAAREAAGITEGLVRLSVGLEDPSDIIADLDRALLVAAGATVDNVDQGASCVTR